MNLLPGPCKPLLIFLFACYSLFMQAAQPPDSEVDSIKTLLSRCQNDTCKFRILMGLFWDHRFAGSGEDAYYGEWAYNTIKSSHDLRSLSNGYDIKGNMLLAKGAEDSALFYFEKALETSLKIGYKFRIAWANFAIGQIYASRNELLNAIDKLKTSCLYFIMNDQIPEAAMCNSHIAAYYNTLGLTDSSDFYYRKNISLYTHHPNSEAEVYNYLDMYGMYRETNKYKEAITYLFHALESAEKLNREEPLFYVYMNIGLLFFLEKKDNHTALSYYTKALSMAEILNRPDLLAMLNIHYCKLYIQNREYDKALEYLRQGLEIAGKINNECSLGEIYYYLGITYRWLDNSDAALDNYYLSLQSASSECPGWYRHDAIISIADIYMETDKDKEAFEWYLRSADIAEKQNSGAASSISFLKLGNYYRKIKQYNNAGKYYKLSYASAIKENDPLLIMNASDSLSSLYSALGKHQLANHFLKISSVMEDSLNKAEKLASIAKFEMMLELEKIRKDNEIEIIKANAETKKQKILRNFVILVSLIITFTAALAITGYKRKKKVNNLLAARNEEILSQKNEMEKMAEKLHEADKMKLNFFTNLSHELRTPLTLIISPLNRLFKNYGDEDAQSLYTVIFRNARKLQGLIDQLLDISKLDQGELKPDMKFHDTGKQIRAIAAMFQSLADEKNIELVTSVQPGDLICYYDSERIEQVMNILLSNAFKFTSPGGRIDICLSVCDVADGENARKNIEIRVKDTGIGIPPDCLEKIFDRFYRAENASKENYNGSGIGLSVARELMELHNGSITAQSSLGNWTEFTLTLPLIPGKIAEASEKPSDGSFRNISTNQHLNTGYGRRSATILLVEDNTDLQNYLSESLSSGFNILTACNGADALKIARTCVPDLIISDIMMPVKNGIELTSELKKDLGTSHIPVILLTARTGQECRIEGLKKGADDYLNKPFDEEELYLRVSNILENRRKLQEKYRKQITVNPTAIHEKSLEEKFLINVTRIIEQNISDNSFNGSSLSQKIGLSRPQLYRKLIALTGLPVNHFIRSIRLKRAAQLLRNKSVSVSEAAYTTGFESLSYFTKKFREEFGKLPSEY